LENLTNSQQMIQQVIARNPNYAPAWALLCGSHWLIANTVVDFDPLSEEQRRIIKQELVKGDAACRQAIVVDPDSATSNAVVGVFKWSVGRQIEGEKLTSKAVALDPDDADVLLAHSGRLAVAGRLKEALPLMLKAHALEPFYPTAGVFAARDLWLAGRNDEAIVLAKTLRAGNRATSLAYIFAFMGKFREAADALTDSPNANSDAIKAAIRLLRMEPGAKLPPQIPSTYPRAIGFLYFSAGEPEPVLKRILNNLESRVDAGLLGGEVAYIWHPAYSPMRKTERFKAFMRKAGYVDYWREKGWPEFCHPTVGDDFECD
jgi:tetratricopeptide (TPR) repeat protein